MSTTTPPAQGSGPVGVGVIGAGVISGAYLKSMSVFADLRVHAIADQDPDAAASRAAEHGIATHGDVQTVLEHPEVEIVVNLTTPAAHVAVGQAAIAAGKHVWNEKPLALDVAAGQSLLDQAEAAGLRVGCAPDTVLGTGLQTARRLIERGDIGTPLTALSLFQNPGPDLWHPNPAFLFGEGAGPLFDIGPYYLTTLIQIFGSVTTVAAMTSTARRQRVIGSGPNAGQTFAVTADTHTGALLGFEAGTSAQAMFSFDSPAPRDGFVEISGSEATLALPDPNRFDGPIRLWRTGAEDWETIETVGGDYERGLGVLEMARAVRGGTPHRASGAMGLHVLDVMASIRESGRTGAFTSVGSQAPDVPVLDDNFDPVRSTLGAA